MNLPIVMEVPYHNVKMGAKMSVEHLWRRKRGSKTKMFEEEGQRNDRYEKGPQCGMFDEEERQMSERSKEEAGVKKEANKGEFQGRDAKE